MLFHQIRTERGCQSYLIGCSETRSAFIIDPEISLIDHYLSLINNEGLVLHYVIDTHTHADHVSGSKALSEHLGVPVIMHSASPAPFVRTHVDDGEMIKVGKLKLSIMHTPGHTADSISILLDDRVFTGDTLLIGSTGRTDLPSGDSEQLFSSLFGSLLKLDPKVKVYPAHIYSQRTNSSIGEELANNPRLQCQNCEEFVTMMQNLNLKMPEHLTESLRSNISGAKSIAEMLNDAANSISFIDAKQLFQHSEKSADEFIFLDVREKELFVIDHIPGAINIPRGQLELKVNKLLADPTRRIAVYCECGTISTLATATLKNLGFSHAVSLDNGLHSWRTLGYPLQK